MYLPLLEASHLLLPLWIIYHLDWLLSIWDIIQFKSNRTQQADPRPLTMAPVVTRAVPLLFSWTPSPVVLHVRPAHLPSPLLPPLGKHPKRHHVHNSPWPPPPSVNPEYLPLLLSLVRRIIIMYRVQRPFHPPVVTRLVLSLDPLHEGGGP